MKRIVPTLRPALAARVALGLTLAALAAENGTFTANAEEPGAGVAVSIVYDTSGSMLQKVRDADGQLTPKHVIADRALRSVLQQLEAVKATPNPPPVHAGLVVFQGDHAAEVVKLAPFSPAPFITWLKGHAQPRAGTPLGDAVRIAGQSVLKSKLPRKHVLVITDGMNTKGPDPAATIPPLQQTARRSNTALSMHFVAFDINAAEFRQVKNLGATVVGAADEKQLKSQLEFIVAKKILLEEEEPPSAKPETK